MMEFISDHNEIVVPSNSDVVTAYRYNTLYRFDFSSTSPSANEWGSRKHSWRKSATRDYYKALFSNLVNLFTVVPYHDMRYVNMHILVERKRLLDKDNLYAGAKPIIDAMRDTDILKDDNPSWLNMNITQYQSKYCSTMTILIYYKES